VRDGQRHSMIADSGLATLTELDAGVVGANLVTLVVGEAHVGGETTLGRVGV